MPDKKGKLKIIPLNARLEKAGEEIEAMYNPKEFTIETSNQYQRTAIPGLPTPVTQFVSGQTQTLSFDLFFDTYETGIDVRTHTSKVIKLVKIDRSLHAPPVCRFIWGGPMKGDNSHFQGVIDKVTQKFTMFLDTGIPVRATLTISVSEYKTIQQQLQELGLQSSDHTKHRIFKQSDSLWLLAYNEYGDAANWRIIAQANQIDNPRLIEPGTELTLPPLE